MPTVSPLLVSFVRQTQQQHHFTILYDCIIRKFESCTKALYLKVLIDKETAFAKDGPGTPFFLFQKDIEEDYRISHTTQTAYIKEFRNLGLLTTWTTVEKGKPTVYWYQLNYEALGAFLTDAFTNPDYESRRERKQRLTPSDPTSPPTQLLATPTQLLATPHARSCDIGSKSSSRSSAASQQNGPPARARRLPIISPVQQPNSSLNTPPANTTEENPSALNSSPAEVASEDPYADLEELHAQDRKRLRPASSPQAAPLALDLPKNVEEIIRLWRLHGVKHKLNSDTMANGVAALQGVLDGTFFMNRKGMELAWGHKHSGAEVQSALGRFFKARNDNQYLPLKKDSIRRVSLEHFFYYEPMDGQKPPFSYFLNCLQEEPKRVNLSKSPLNETTLPLVAAFHQRLKEKIGKMNGRPPAIELSDEDVARIIKDRLLPFRDKYIGRFKTKDGLMPDEGIVRNFAAFLLEHFADKHVWNMKLVFPQWIINEHFLEWFTKDGFILDKPLAPRRDSESAATAPPAGHP